MTDFAGPDETGAYVASQGADALLLFTEDRTNPVRRDDALPRVWLRRAKSDREGFAGEARPGEFYVFQVAVYNATDSAHDVISAQIEMPQLPVSALHCINFEARPYDEPPLCDGLPLAARSLKTLWMAVEAPARTGVLNGTVRIVCRDVVAGRFRTLTASITLHVAGEPIPDGGVDEAARLARLQWLLPSELGCAPEPTRGYAPVIHKGDRIQLTGCTLALAPNGLPAQVESRFNGSNTTIGSHPRDLLRAPVRLVVEIASGPVALHPQGVRFLSEERDGVSWESRSEAVGLDLRVAGRVEFDGCLIYTIRLTAARTIDLKDVRLEVPYRTDAARFQMGMGARGGRRTAPLDWHWDTAKHQDRIWIGDVNVGAQWQFKGANYRRPLVNIYYGFRPLALPESWGNGGRGGATVRESAPDTVLFTAYSGARRLAAGQSLDFDIEVTLTPSRPIDTDRQWATRYYHPGGDTGLGESYLASMRESGANVINIHHAQRLNPFINYPFNDASVPELTDFVRRAHADNERVKVYYTTRELTQNMPEFFALHSLDGAVIQPGPGPLTRTLIHPNGPDAWLNENLRKGFIPAWVAELDGKYAGRRDLSVLTRPDGPWNDFYLRGLDWLARKTEIDGVYIDDTALDRRTLLRARRILEARRPEPLIDLHSWNPFSTEDSYIVSASLYMDLMPFVDRLWLGEAADYNQGPDAWLIQYAGIPYGVMSEMLQDGGNPWHGMLFGMTGRLPWAGDPRPLWKFWDAFGMRGTQMIGWWDPACPVTTGRDDVPVTVYRKSGKALLAIASWATETANITLRIDWKALGLDPRQIRLHAIEIPGFQSATTFTPEEAIPVAPKRGWLLTLE